MPPLTGPEVSVPAATLTFAAVTPSRLVVRPAIEVVNAPDCVSEVVSIGFPPTVYPSPSIDTEARLTFVRSLLVVRVARLTRFAGKLMESPAAGGPAGFQLPGEDQFPLPA